MSKVVNVNEVCVLGAETQCQYIDVSLPLPKSAILVQSNVPLELLAGDMGILTRCGTVVEGYQVTLSQETILSFHNQKAS